MEQQTTNNKLTLENTWFFLKLDSRVIEKQIKKTPFGYRYTKHVNDFLKPIESDPEAYLKLFSLEQEKIKFSVTIKPDKRIFFGTLHAGRPATLGINFKLVITEHFHRDTQTYSCSLDASLSLKEEPEISDFARNLFDIPEKPNNDKPRKRKGAK